MNHCTESAVRHALSLAAKCQSDGYELTASRQRDIVALAWVASDKQEARSRRNVALRRAFELLGPQRDTPIPLLYSSMRDFERTKWPGLQSNASVPEGTTPLHRAFFEACAAAAAGGINLPEEHQLRKIVK